MSGIRLTTTSPFDGRGLMRYFASHAVPGVESGDGEHYRRMIRGTDGPASVLRVVLDGPDGVRASLDGGDIPPSLIRGVRRLFDLDADSLAIDMHLSQDPVLASAVATNPGVRLPGALDAHEQLLRTMIGQQISIAATRTILGRISRELDGTGLFPTATQFFERGLNALHGPASRIAAVHGAAAALHMGALEVNLDLAPDELTTRLLALKGIGPWTAGYVAMRVLGAPDVLLASDLVLLKGAARLGLPATSRGIEEHGQRWAPYRSYATLHLWRAAQSP